MLNLIPIGTALPELNLHLPMMTFLDFFTNVVRVQRQADAIHFYLSNAFDLVPHNMLLHDLDSFGFSGTYVSWFRSYLTNRRSRVRVCGTLSQPFEVTSGVSQGSVLAPILFNLFINDLCSSVHYCKLLIFADNLKIFDVINSPHACLLLQSDISSVSDWCIANSMRLNTAKTRVVSYSRKTKFLSYNYQLCRATITHASSIEDKGVFFGSKLHFHNHVDYVFSKCIQLLGFYSLYNLQLFFPVVFVFYTLL
jgi:hypothetical protein